MTMPASESKDRQEASWSGGALVINLDPDWNFVQRCRQNLPDRMPDRNRLRLWDLGPVQDGDSSFDAFWEHWPSRLPVDAPDGEPSILGQTVADLCVEELGEAFANHDGPVPVILLFDGLSFLRQVEDGDGDGDVVGTLRFFDRLHRRLNGDGARRGIIVCIVRGELPSLNEALEKLFTPYPLVAGVIALQADGRGARMSDRSSFLRFRFALDWVTSGGLKYLTSMGDTRRGMPEAALPVFSVQALDEKGCDVDRRTCAALRQAIDHHWERLGKPGLDDQEKGAAAGREDFGSEVQEILARLQGISEGLHFEPSTSGGDKVIGRPSTFLDAQWKTSGPDAEALGVRRIEEAARSGLLAIAEWWKRNFDHEVASRRQALQDQILNRIQEVRASIAGLRQTDVSHSSREAHLNRALIDVTKAISDLDREIDEYSFRLSGKPRDASGSAPQFIGAGLAEYADYEKAAKHAVEAYRAQGPSSGGRATSALLACVLLLFAGTFLAFRLVYFGPEIRDAFWTTVGIPVLLFPLITVVPLIAVVNHSKSSGMRQFKGRLEALDDAASKLQQALRNNFVHSYEYVALTQRRSVLEELRARLDGIRREAETTQQFRGRLVGLLSGNEPADAAQWTDARAWSLGDDPRHWIDEVLQGLNETEWFGGLRSNLTIRFDAGSPPFEFRATFADRPVFVELSSEIGRRTGGQTP